MKLSHKKKLASKRGKWWPFTRQMRTQSKLPAVMFLKRYAVIVDATTFTAAAARLAQAATVARKAMSGMVEQCKAWLVRDSSQHQLKNQNKALLASFCLQKPQNEIKIKNNHKTS